MTKFKIITISILGLIICGLGVYAICNIYTGNMEVENIQPMLPDEPQAHYTNLLSPPPLPDSIVFCGEVVPLHLYWVNEGVDRELINQCYQHSRTLLSLKRSTRFFPVIETILKKENLPADLKYLCVAESNLENVVSPAKATGFWQFMEATGKH
jgi:hypothetical protein